MFLSLHSEKSLLLGRSPDEACANIRKLPSEPPGVHTLSPSGSCCKQWMIHVKVMMTIHTVVITTTVVTISGLISHDYCSGNTAMLKSNQLALLLFFASYKIPKVMIYCCILWFQQDWLPIDVGTTRSSSE